MDYKKRQKIVRSNIHRVDDHNQIDNVKNENKIQDCKNEIVTNSTNWITKTTNFSEKVVNLNQAHQENYICEICDYNTIRKFDFNKHLLTIKHKYKQQNNLSELNKNNKNIIEHDESDIKNDKKINECKCGKIYKFRQGLYNHKKKCNFNLNQEQQNQLIETTDVDLLNEVTYKQLFLQALEQNNTIQNAFIEQNKHIVNMIPNLNQMNVVNNNNNTNSNNKIKIKNNYNIHLFLNENCKNAINMSDFINNLEVGVNDLKLTGEKGLAEGISNLLITNLNKIPIPDRPIWCSDMKRKKIFIKQEVWEEDENNSKTKEAISNISTIQTKNINKFIENTPNWIQNSKQKDDYIMIVKHSTDDINDKKDKILEKFIKNIHLTGEKLNEIESIIDNR